MFVVPRGGAKNERTKEALRTIENVVKYSTTSRDFYKLLNTMKMCPFVDFSMRYHVLVFYVLTEETI